jgi:hypothetical protein
MKGLFGSPSQPPPPSPPPAVGPVVVNPDTRPKKKSMVPTFLGTEQSPSFIGSAAGGGTGKTLLGQ